MLTIDYYKLKSLRFQAKLSQNKLADLLSIDQGRYSKIENGKINPSNVELNKFVGFYKISKEDLLIENISNSHNILSNNIILGNFINISDKIDNATIKQFLNKLNDLLKFYVEKMNPKNK
ncbi:MAG: helix-turn-helix transcriptional regulator [Sediminibacterium sp.]|nr:helix-turn-helix transcriptional regulator [Sediminibacterium sp.]